MPYSPDAPTLELKDWLHELDSTRPGVLRNFAKSFTKIENHMEDEGDVTNCESCGYAASTKICRFCKVMSAIGVNTSHIEL